MKRLLLLVTVALVMAAMMLAMALPAIAGPPGKVVSCYTPTGEVVAGFSTNEAGGFKYQGTFRAGCISEGYVVTQEVTAEPGPSNPYPPGQGGPIVTFERPPIP
jgi:hypothetical protein